jgi:hypothetical protein
MKWIPKAILSVGLNALILCGCQTELTNINQNPNNLETPDVTTLTSNLIVNEFWNNADQAWLLGNALSQLVVFNAHYYNINGARFFPINNGSYWSLCYANARDGATIVTQSKKAGNTANQAIGLALQSYAFLQLTDCWGDIPYTQALQGTSGTYLAAYDNQQTVYTGILAKLNTADSLLAHSNSVIKGDVLYNGNITKWRKFINGLRLRSLLRVSAKTDVSAQMQDIVNAGYIFQNASESAALKLPTTLPWYFPSFADRSTDFAVKSMDSILYKFYASTGDKDRLTLFFAPSPNGAANSAFSFSNYGGLPQVDQVTTQQANGTSLFADSFNPLKTYTSTAANYARIITYAEVQYILAEAALRGLIPGGLSQAQTYYNAGVLGAYAELGLPSTDAATYLAANPLNTDPTNNYAAATYQIIMQKWALNLNNGFEGWLEQRRTGIPTFDLNYNMNNGVVTTKFLYPADEEFINANNYKIQVAKMGGKDSPNYRAWW